MVCTDQTLNYFFIFNLVEIYKKELVVWEKYSDRFDIPSHAVFTVVLIYFTSSFILLKYPSNLTYY